MSTKNFSRWILAFSLALGAAGIFGYKTIMVNQGQPVCTQQAKEGQDKKLKSSIPMWESLSSHLIMQSRN
jgi:hypothetical protein